MEKIQPKSIKLAVTTAKKNPHILQKTVLLTNKRVYLLTCAKYISFISSSSFFPSVPKCDKRP